MIEKEKKKKEKRGRTTLTGKRGKGKNAEREVCNRTEGKEGKNNNARAGIVILNPIKRRFLGCILSSLETKRGTRSILKFPRNTCICGTIHLLPLNRKFPFSLSLSLSFNNTTNNEFHASSSRKAKATSVAWQVTPCIYIYICIYIRRKPWHVLFSMNRLEESVRRRW